jgi:sodium-coupled neutral amino acid transporter 11
VIEQYFFSHEAFSPQRHLFFTTTILFASMFRTFVVHPTKNSRNRLTRSLHAVSLITCDLGVMLEITGGVSATALAYIFPAACYLKLSDRRQPWYSRAKLPAVVCTAFGFVVMIISLALALRKVWTPEGNAKICV